MKQAEVCARYHINAGRSATSIVATLLHGYHYTQLDPKDKKVFTKKIGIGTLLVSIGILVMPIINLISHSELGYYIGLILIVVGVFYIIFIIVKYNGKLISFKK